eukprot:1175378-Prorocentrum_minimum.AAC.3
MRGLRSHRPPRGRLAALGLSDRLAIGRCTGNVKEFSPGKPNRTPRNLESSLETSGGGPENS